MEKIHTFNSTLAWRNEAPHDPFVYEGYSRDHEVIVEGGKMLSLSAASEFKGNPDKCNPEDLLIAAIASCHMLSYLAICARKRIKVLSYEDEVHGEMRTQDGRMRITRVELKPVVVYEEGTDLQEAVELHEAAHRVCFIANSVTCDIVMNPRCLLAEAE